MHGANGQWRSKALRGPGSTVTWGPPFPSPPFPLPPSPFPLFPSSAPPLPRSGPQILPPAGSGAEPQPKSNLVHFSLKIRHLVATILMIFIRVLPKNFLWPHYSGAPGARGPRFIEPPEPPVPTPLRTVETLQKLRFSVTAYSVASLVYIYCVMMNVQTVFIPALAVRSISQKPLTLFRCLYLVHDYSPRAPLPPGSKCNRYICRCRKFDTNPSTIFFGVIM